MRVLVTGGAGVAGQAVSRMLLDDGHFVRMADVGPKPSGFDGADYQRCDTRTPDDVRRAVSGMDGVVHLAAWHCGHNPPVSDPTIFAVNVDGTFHVLEACRAENIQNVVYASSMAYGFGGVYSVTKVIGEDLCRAYHEMTGMRVVLLRYHDFVPKPYLAFGAKLLRNGVDARDVAAATVASLRAAAEGRIGLFRTIVHTNHHLPPEVAADFRRHGPDWCESHIPGAKKLLEKYEIDLPGGVEQHDLSEAERLTGWTPKFGFSEFLTDLKARDERGEDVRNRWSPGQIS